MPTQRQHLSRATQRQIGAFGFAAFTFQAADWCGFSVEQEAAQLNSVNSLLRFHGRYGFICDEQPSISFCDIEDFAEVISCMAVVLFSPSGIFMTAASALASQSSVQAVAFDSASGGEAAKRKAPPLSMSVFE
jgi:hypothetical protein